jgi:hypothetical protein
LARTIAIAIDKGLLRGDDEIRSLIERLNARRAQGGIKLIAMRGASGSGKSSLLRAGVIPRLKREPRNWIVLPPMRPQAHPIDELARTIAIAIDKGLEWRAWRDRLREDDLAGVLGDLAGDLRVRSGANEAQILRSLFRLIRQRSCSVPPWRRKPTASSKSSALPCPRRYPTWRF